MTLGWSSCERQQSLPSHEWLRRRWQRGRRQFRRARFGAHHPEKADLVAQVVKELRFHLRFNGDGANRWGPGLAACAAGEGERFAQKTDGSLTRSRSMALSANTSLVSRWVISRTWPVIPAMAARGAGIALYSSTRLERTDGQLNRGRGLKQVLEPWPRSPTCAYHGQECAPCHKCPKANGPTAAACPGRGSCGCQNGLPRWSPRPSQRHRGWLLQLVSRLCSPWLMPSTPCTECLGGAEARLHGCIAALVLQSSLHECGAQLATALPQFSPRFPCKATSTVVPPAPQTPRDVLPLKHIRVPGQGGR